MAGCDIPGGSDGVKFTYNSGGRPSGECFVEFSSEQDLEEAMKKDKNYLQKRYIEGKYCSVMQTTIHGYLQTS